MLCSEEIAEVKDIADPLYEFCWFQDDIQTVQYSTVCISPSTHNVIVNNLDPP